MWQRAWAKAFSVICCYATAMLLLYGFLHLYVIIEVRVTVAARGRRSGVSQCESMRKMRCAGTGMSVCLDEALHIGVTSFIIHRTKVNKLSLLGKVICMLAGYATVL